MFLLKINNSVSVALQSSNLQSFAHSLVKKIKDTVKDARQMTPSAKENLLQYIDGEIKKTPREATKLLGCLIYAYVATASKPGELPYDFQKNLELIASGDFAVELPESPIAGNKNHFYVPLAPYVGSDYDQSLLYLPTTIIFNEKYGRDGIYLGNVAALVIPSFTVDGQPGQKSLVEALQRHRINPFKDATILEVGGSHIKTQPLASLFACCDSIDVLSKTFSTRKDYLLMDTYKHFADKKYQFVISSRVLEHDSEMNFVARADETGDELIYNCFAAMANLTQRGGYAIHRSLKWENLYNDKRFHDFTGMHGAPEELSLVREIKGFRKLQQIHMYYKYKDKIVTPKELLHWYADRNCPSVAMR